LIWRVGDGRSINI
jgi:hypothetical protein